VWQVVVAAVGCVLLVVAVAVVAAALNPAEGVSLADLVAVGLTAMGLMLPLLAWVRGSAVLAAGAGGTPAGVAAGRGVGGAVGAAQGLAVPRQLPAAVAGFAGRRDELAALMSLLERPPSGGTVVISAVDGAAGIGKTSLALCWAHRVADRFPDGQLYVNLRGFDPAGSPVTPAEAVRGFLDAFEVPAGRIPLGVDAQASLYRSILAGRRVLVVLDNARDAAQVRPLLPGSPRCVVVVTSRTRLTGLIAEGARSLTVDLLSVDEARELLVHRLGASRVAAEQGPVLEIIIRCARLPLALSVVAARAAMHPGFPLAVLATELRQARGGLQAFSGGEVSVDVRAVFSWSYQRLGAVAARVFRLLGLHPGPDISAAAAASLAGLDIAQTRQALAELAGYHLVAEQAPGRFGFHDLLRAYAAELVGTHDTDAERCLARERMLDHYLHTAHAANMLFCPSYEQVTIAAALPGVMVEQIADGTAALAWFEAEYAVLLAAVQLAVDTGLYSHAWQLPHDLREFCHRCGRWADWLDIERTALGAAQRHGNRDGRAHTHQGLGIVLTLLGSYDEADDHLRLAVGLFAKLGDPTGQADCYSWISAVLESQGYVTDALAHVHRALDLARTAGSPRLLVRCLSSVGWFHARLGEPEQTFTYSGQGLTLSREIGDREGQASVLGDLGYAHYRLGQYQQAIDHFQPAITIYRELGDQNALLLNLLGDAHHAAGDHDVARAAWQQSVNILDQYGIARIGIGPGYVDVDEINAKIHRLDTTNSHSRPTR
jgi:tetratricopeptide (TPR) repeat protein